MEMKRMSSATIARGCNPSVLPTPSRPLRTARPSPCLGQGSLVTYLPPMRSSHLAMAAPPLANNIPAPLKPSELLEAPSAPTRPTSRLPVTVLSGFLGAGKTTLLKRILTNDLGLKICVIVNDVANLNVDEELLLLSSTGQGATVTLAKENLVALSNGCICCSIREDLVQAVTELSAGGSFDYLVIESTGVSVPMPIAATFEVDGEEGEGGGLRDVAYLDTLVTVVDAQRFVSNVLEAEYLQDVGMAVDEEDERTIADLLVEQVELANVLVLNKTDLVSVDEVAQLKLLLRKLNSSAKIIESVNCQVPIEDMLDTKTFSSSLAQESPGWIQELNRFEADRLARAASTTSSSSGGGGVDAGVDAGAADAVGSRASGSGGASSSGHSHADDCGSGSEAHSHHHDHQHHHHGSGHAETELEKYKISSFVYYARRPFHPGRLMETALSSSWEGVLRTKGFFWLATRHDVMGIWHSAGGAWQGEPGARWAAAKQLPDPEEALDPQGAAPPELNRLRRVLLDEVEDEEVDKSGWDEQWGDRCQQVVWIGIGMDEPALTAMLDSCLLTEDEMALGPEGWLEQLEDPLPPWLEEMGESEVVEQ